MISFYRSVHYSSFTRNFMCRFDCWRCTKSHWKNSPANANGIRTIECRNEKVLYIKFRFIPFEGKKLLNIFFKSRKKLVILFNQVADFDALWIWISVNPLELSEKCNSMSSNDLCSVSGRMKYITMRLKNIPKPNSISKIETTISFTKISNRILS